MLIFNFYLTTDLSQPTVRGPPNLIFWFLKAVQKRPIQTLKSLSKLCFSVLARGCPFLGVSPPLKDHRALPASSPEPGPRRRRAERGGRQRERERERASLEGACRSSNIFWAWPFAILQTRVCHGRGQVSSPTLILRHMPTTYWLCNC